MKIHYHFSPENVLFAGLSALIVFNLIRFVSIATADKEGAIGTAGRGLGSLIHFNP